MGTHSEFLRGTAQTLRRIATEADQHFTEATTAAAEAEAAHAQQDAHALAELAAKYPALGQR